MTLYYNKTPRTRVRRRAGRGHYDRATVLVDKAPNDAEVVAALWDLVWAGLVTGDTLGPLRAQVAGHGAHKPRRQAPRGRYARLRAGRPQMPSRSGPPTVAGRWALTPARETDATRRAHARTEAFADQRLHFVRAARQPIINLLSSDNDTRSRNTRSGSAATFFSRRW